MVKRARTRLAERSQVSVLQADAHALPAGDASVDLAWTDRTLQHAADPDGVLAEVHRVLRPGGRLVMAEPDWESLVFDHPDPDASRAYTRHLVDRMVRNALIGRQLPRRAARAGFDVGEVVPVTSVLRDAREADRILACGATPNGRRRPVISPPHRRKGGWTHSPMSPFSRRSRCTWWSPTGLPRPCPAKTYDTDPLP